MLKSIDIGYKSEMLIRSQIIMLQSTFINVLFINAIKIQYKEINSRISLF